MVKREYYIEGVKHGPLTQWYDSGKLFLEGAYNEGMLDGRWIIYYEDGSLGSTATYNMGSGVQIGYSPDGLMMTKIHFKDNEKDGEEIRYNRKGEVVEILVWEEGEFVKKIDKK
jgi:antitoxin component YwqK of YwqJK toxin-antitoxin module